MDSGFTLWFTGLSGAGKTTLGARMEAELRARGRRVELLDGDVVRAHLSNDLGFSREDRDNNILRIGWVCQVLTRNDVIAIATAISPYRGTRDRVRASIGRFVEVYVDCPLETCIRRDTKGLYKKALAGEINQFTGISDPYEPPVQAEITIHSAEESVDESIVCILGWLENHGYLEPAPIRASAVPVSESAKEPLAPLRSCDGM